MRHLLVLLLLFCGVITLRGEAVVVIKGKERRITIRKDGSSGLSSRVGKYNRTTEVVIRPRKDFQTAKLTFEVRKDDEFTFTIGGGYTRTDSDKKDFFEWIDCSLFRVNGKDLIGPKVEKGGKKSESFFRPKPIKGSIKLKKGSKLTLEITVRSTPKKEAKKRTIEGSKSKRQKERMKREEAKEKARAEEAAREEKERKAVAEANSRLMESRYGVKKKKTVAQEEKSGSGTASAAASQAPAEAAPEEPDEGGNQ